MSRLAALLIPLAVLGCGDPTVRCDELDRSSCNRPLVRSTQTVRSIRTRMPRLPESTPADLRSVVITAYDTYDEDGTGRVGNLFFQEISPNNGSTDPWAPCPLLRERNVRVCALSVFSPQLAPSGFRPTAGDMVDVTGGAYTEFTCAPCGREFENGRFIPQVSNPTITSAGVAPTPVAIPVTLEELVDHNDTLIGNLVTVTDVSVSSDPDRFNEVNVGMGVKLSFQMFPSAGISRGTRLRRVTGIAYYFYGVKLIPRTVADIERAE